MKKVLLILFLMFFIPHYAWAAISYTSVTNYDTSSFITTHTLNVTGCDATNDAVGLIIYYRNASEITSGPTIDGNAMTLEVSAVNTNVTGVLMYSYINPDNDFDIVIGTASSKTMSYDVVCVSGVDQTDSVEATASTGGFGSSVSLSITTLTDGALILTGMSTQFDKGAGLTPEAGFTEISDYSTASSDLGQAGAGYQFDATAGSETTGWSFASDNYQIASMAFKPAASDTVTSATIQPCSSTGCTHTFTFRTDDTVTKQMLLQKERTSIPDNAPYEIYVEGGKLKFKARENCFLSCGSEEDGIWSVDIATSTWYSAAIVYSHDGTDADNPVFALNGTLPSVTEELAPVNLDGDTLWDLLYVAQNSTGGETFGDELGDIGIIYAELSGNALLNLTSGVRRMPLQNSNTVYYWTTDSSGTTQYSQTATSTTINNLSNQLLPLIY